MSEPDDHPDDENVNHTIICGHCGAENDLEAVKQQQCCHDCRGQITI